jgi:hypothetical protein
VALVSRSQPRVREAEARLRFAGIEVPRRFELDGFVNTLEQLRGRRLQLNAVSLPVDEATFCGCCIPGENADHVYYPAGRSPVHRLHNVLHELSHLIWDHLPVVPPISAMAAGISAYDPDTEDQAEAMAGVILGHSPDLAARERSAHTAVRVTAERIVHALG